MISNEKCSKFSWGRSIMVSTRKIKEGKTINVYNKNESED
jgi:hypothetical protein